VASHEIVCPSEPYRRHRIEPIGLARSRHGLGCFQLTFTVFRVTPAPVIFRFRVHSLLDLHSSSEYVTTALRLSLHERQWPPLGFGSPSRHLLAESTYRQSSQLCLRSVLSVSRALDGLLLHKLCGSISPHYHVRDSLFRGFPQHPAGLTRRQTVPS
jgi:hypothetical protein